MSDFVYLAYVRQLPYCDAPTLIGVFRNKADAWRAAHEEAYRMIEQEFEIGDRLLKPPQYRPRIEPMELQ